MASIAYNEFRSNIVACYLHEAAKMWHGRMPYSVVHQRDSLIGQSNTLKV